MSSDPIGTSDNLSSASISAAVGENRMAFVAVGVALIICGLIAIAAPFLTTIVAKLFLGWMFLFSGIVQIIHAFTTQSWKGIIGSTLIGLIYFVAGVWLTFFPLTGILELTLFLAIMFVLEGISKFFIAFKTRPQDGWLWMLTSGIISIVLGFMIFNRLPASGTWAIGLLVGSNLLISGLVFLGIAVGTKSSSN